MPWVSRIGSTHTMCTFPELNDLQFKSVTFPGSIWECPVCTKRWVLNEYGDKDNVSWTDEHNTTTISIVNQRGK